MVYFIFSLLEPLLNISIVDCHVFGLFYSNFQVHLLYFADVRIVFRERGLDFFFRSMVSHLLRHTGTKSPCTENTFDQYPTPLLPLSQEQYIVLDHYRPCSLTSLSPTPPKPIVRIMKSRYVGAFFLFFVILLSLFFSFFFFPSFLQGNIRTVCTC